MLMAYKKPHKRKAWFFTVRGEDIVVFFSKPVTRAQADSIYWDAGLT